MFLLGNAGTITQVVLVSVVACLVFAALIVLLLKYIFNVNYMEHVKAEKNIAIAGYYSILSMIALFLLIAFGYKNDVVDIERNYIGLVSIALSAVLLPFLVIYDIRQIRWIKDLTPDEQKSYGISIKDRRPLIIIISILVIVNFALIGLCIESLIYVIQGIVS